jgi:hypothetical protein
MNIVAMGAAFASLIAAAILVGACQQPSPAGAAQSMSAADDATADHDARRNRCCRHAGKNNSK